MAVGHKASAARAAARALAEERCLSPAMGPFPSAVRKGWMRLSHSIGVPKAAGTAAWGDDFLSLCIPWCKDPGAALSFPTCQCCSYWCSGSLRVWGSFRHWSFRTCAVFETLTLQAMPGKVLGGSEVPQHPSNLWGSRKCGL